ncbi:MAG TPA: hypothetical protein VG125_32265 [Pirellulales bacterium]|nr:hypothetical protein [Pirellulales bacterium]
MATLAFVVCVLSGMACGLAALISMFRAASMRKPRVPWQLAIKVLNVLFDPALYTEDGLRAVRRSKQSILGFFLFWALGMAIGISTGVAR